MEHMFYIFCTQILFQKHVCINLFLHSKQIAKKKFFNFILFLSLHTILFKKFTLFEILMEIYSNVITKRKFKFIDLSSLVLICLNLPLTLCSMYFRFHPQNLGNLKHIMNMLKQSLHPIEYVFASCTNLCTKH
jgi:hypothetical protein